MKERVHGLSGRVLALHASSEEILVVTNYVSDAAVGRTDCVHKGLCCRAFHLHDLLGVGRARPRHIGVLSRQRRRTRRR